MDPATATLLDDARTANDRGLRRQAFIRLLRSAAWREALTPDVLSRQSLDVGSAPYPDLATFELAAEPIAADEAKVQRSLELAGAQCSAELLIALARRMGAALVEPAMAHLRTADGPRATLLLYVLQAAAERWILVEGAESIVRRQLKTPGLGRLSLMACLVNNRRLAPHIAVIEAHPPDSVEEWSVLGHSGIHSQTLIERALALLPYQPAPLLYLIRLDPVPSCLQLRLLAAARGDWLVNALELAVADGIKHPALLPLAELAIRAGGQTLAAANTWIATTRIARELLQRLAEEMQQAGQRDGNERFWLRRNTPSAKRALDSGRSGQVPQLTDAAALIREISDEQVPAVVSEILSMPREALIESVLRPLCATHPGAARQVVRLCGAEDAPTALRAQQARRWSDVLWPDDSKLAVRS